MSEIKIRKAKVEDMEAVNAAHRRSIKEVCSKDYTAEQIEKWSDVTYALERWKNTIENECCYILEQNNEIYGVCHSKIHDDNRGEIVGLYLTPEVIGKGLGRKIFEKCLSYVKDFKPALVFINGTITAKGFYEAMGFHAVEEKQINIRGADVKIHYMEMNL
ncbi:GNAT family N-acetyltransferase [Halobacteriovorax marinus]|uniref:GNAT family N-acetyltransferase n=1 Tax=Halobacteriovorax marinus TaxID=97084 RepID=UPI003A910999